MGIRNRSIAVAAISAVALAGAASPALAQKKTITVTTPKSSPFAFTGMPKTLKAGTYTFRHVNKSGIGHNLMFLKSASTARKGTPIFTSGARTVRVTLKKGTARYVCTPHASIMKGTIRVT